MTHLLSFSYCGLFGDDPVLPAADSRCVANYFLSFARKTPAIGLASNSEAASSGSYARRCALMQAVQLVPGAREAAFGYRLRSRLAVRLLALFSVGETWKPAGLWSQSRSALGADERRLAHC